MDSHSRQEVLRTLRGTVEFEPILVSANQDFIISIQSDKGRYIALSSNKSRILKIRPHNILTAFE
jgi:hypothetical protein